MLLSSAHDHAAGGGELDHSLGLAEQWLQRRIEREWRAVRLEVRGILRSDWLLRREHLRNLKARRRARAYLPTSDVPKMGYVTQRELVAAEAELRTRAAGDWKNARLAASARLRRERQFERWLSKPVRRFDPMPEWTPGPVHRYELEAAEVVLRRQAEREWRRARAEARTKFRRRSHGRRYGFGPNEEYDPVPPFQYELNAAETAIRRRAESEWGEARDIARAVLKQQRREQRSRESAERRYRWREEIPRVVSFDAPLPSGVGWGDLYIPGLRELDPAVALTEATADHMEDILGDLAIEDVARLDEHQLENLRQRILEAGLAPSSVQRSERERLREPERHRGRGGPGPDRQRMSTKRKHRKPGHQSSAGGNRSARKPQKRWSREAA